MWLAPRRVIARRPLWVSVICRPVVRRVNSGRGLQQQPARCRSCRRRRRGSGCRARNRHCCAVERVEQRGDIGGAMLAVGVEGHDEVGALRRARIRCRSASAAPCPRLTGCCTTARRPSRATPGVPSCEPSSTTTTRVAGAPRPRAPRRAMTCGLVIGGDDDQTMRFCGPSHQPATRKSPNAITAMPDASRSETARQRPSRRAAA